jgi:hypothetical protein
MIMRELILAIQQKHKKNGITFNRPASQAEINEFEKIIGWKLPADFREFYSICNGFECTEDLFNMTSLVNIRDYGKNWFHFAEYMIYSDMWSLRKKDDGGYEIFNQGVFNTIFTSSLQEFLETFLRGGVLEKGGLYDWHEELKTR